MADAICQGLSPDPELFVNRLDLLGPYTMIEYLFIADTAYTPMGERHVRLLKEYKERITRLAKPLLDDCRHFRPVAGTYSPYGVLFGFSSNILEHMAFKILQPDAVTRFSLEDVFTAGDADKLAWVSGWRKLPHITREMAKMFEYPQQFAEEIFARIERALGQADAAVQTGRLIIADESTLPSQYFYTDADDPKGFMHSRQEGEFLVSYQTSTGRAAITKDILTEVLGKGQDAKVGGLPPAAARVLRLMFPNE
jgi:hypothetical protein